jgi:small subunit ribosomal protein S17
MGDRNQRKVREGRVVSTAMDKTAVVVMKRRLPHPVYGKYVTKDKKFYVHDEENQCQVGDVVRIMETRPLSKLKRWRLIEILERAKIS